jgi:hypothetical protein
MFNECGQLRMMLDRAKIPYTHIVDPAKIAMRCLPVAGIQSIVIVIGRDIWCFDINDQLIEVFDP